LITINSAANQVEHCKALSLSAQISEICGRVNPVVLLSDDTTMAARSKDRSVPQSTGQQPRGEGSSQTPSCSVAQPHLPSGYANACRLAEQGRYEEARRAYAYLDRRVSKKNIRLRALIQNDIAVLAALEGNIEEARDGWRRSLEADGELLLARLNRDRMEAEISLAAVHEELGELKLVPAPRNGAVGVPQALRPPSPLPSPIEGEGDLNCRRSDDVTCSVRVSDPGVGPTGGLHDLHARNADSPIRIAILSFLFNWPSTGGGNMHTAGLVEFLTRAGYQVRHYFARFPPWGIGRAAEGGLVASEEIEFQEAGWNVAEIQRRYRRAVDEFQPDYVAITDTWNMKSLLAEAMRGYPVFLLFQAQECLCPLNNLRLLGIGPTQVEQCPRNQLATPQVCHGCLAGRGRHSGALHRVERALAGVGTAEYDHKLRRSLLEAEAVLALNPLTAAMLEPYSRRVCVVPCGIDAARFPWRSPGVARDEPLDWPTRLFMAAVAGETIKGFHVAHEACRLLRQSRTDFELVVTFDPPGQIDEFTRSVGWQSQAELPRHYQSADICLVPTIAQDGLSITSVEAMASGLPVIASRIGGLPYTVSDGVTGLLCEPGDPADLAAKIARLLDDPELRREMGLAGRRRFEADFTWESVIERYWRPLLGRRATAANT
jgi:glycosyltransferase involved in cell wall biosynthesis